MKAISLDLRCRVIEAHEQEGQSRRQITKRFKVSDSWLGKFLRRRRETGSIERLPCRGGNRSVLSGPNLLVLQQVIDRKPDATLDEIQLQLEKDHDLHVSHSALARAVGKVDRPLKKNGPRERAGYAAGDAVAPVLSPGGPGHRSESSGFSG